ncbi:MAG TPA: DinB family protein [Actinomycetota bacterium]|jgi:hypothetical protein
MPALTPQSVPDREAPFATLQAALTVIGSTPAVLRGLVGGLDAAVLLAAPGSTNDPSWGPRQVAEHLLDAEDIGFMDRVRRLVAAGEGGEPPYIRSIDPSARLVAGGYAERTLEDLLDELEQRRAGDVAWLRSLPASALASIGEHDRAGTFAAGDLVHYWACHDLLHLRQIARALQDTLAPFTGNLAMFFEDA